MMSPGFSSTSVKLLDIINEINANSFLRDQIVQSQYHSAANSSPVEQDSSDTSEDDGWKDKRQGIVFADFKSDGSVILVVTNKAAGFVVGSKGSCIRAICQRTGAWSKSWITKSHRDGLSCYTLPLRHCLITGSEEALIPTIMTIIAAVERYKQLVTGQVKEHIVNEDQVIDGVAFKYKPPPLHLMPQAARTFNSDSVTEQNRYNQTLAAANSIQPLFTYPYQDLSKSLHQRYSPRSPTDLLPSFNPQLIHLPYQQPNQVVMPMYATPAVSSELAYHSQYDMYYMQGYAQHPSQMYSWSSANEMHRYNSNGFYACSYDK